MVLWWASGGGKGYFFVGIFNAEPFQMMYAGLFSKLAQEVERIWPQMFFGLSGRWQLYCRQWFCGGRAVAQRGIFSLREDAFSMFCVLIELERYIVTCLIFLNRGDGGKGLPPAWESVELLIRRLTVSAFGS